MLFENSLYRLSIDPLGDICGDSQKDWEKIFFSFLHFALDSSFSPTKDSQVTFQNFSGWFCCFYVLDTLSITIDTYSISQEHKTHWIGSWALPRWKLFCRRVKKWNRMELSEPFSKYHLAFSILSCISTDRGRGGRVKEVRSRKISQHFFFRFPFGQSHKTFSQLNESHSFPFSICYRTPSTFIKGRAGRWSFAVSLLLV